MLTLKNRGHEVESIIEDSRSWENRSAIGKLTDVATMTHSPRIQRQISEKIRDFQPQVMNVHNIFPFVTPAAYEAAHVAGVPVVQTLHNFRWFCMNGLMFRDGHPCELCLEHGNPASGIVRGCYQDSRARSVVMGATLAIHKLKGTWSTRIAAYIALSDFSRGKYLSAGFPAEKIRVIRNGVSTSDVSHAPRGASFLYIGRLSSEKGLDTLIDADDRYRRAGGKAPLVIAGDGPLFGLAEAHSRKYPASVSIAGRVDEAERSRLLSQASYLLFPTVCYENCPYVVLESFAAGVPVIGSRIGGVPELLTGDENFLVPAGDGAALAAAMARSEVEMARWPGHSEAVRRRATERFSLERWITETEDVYRSVGPNS